MLDPITLATLAGLLAAWDGLRDKRRSRDVAEFQRWLADHAFDDLVDAVNSNSDLAESIEGLLHDHHDEVMKALNAIMSALQGNNAKIKHVSVSMSPHELAIKWAQNPSSVFGDKDLEVMTYAIKDHDGSLFRVKVRGGRVLNIGGVVFEESKLGREEMTKYWGAIDRLERLNFLVSLDNKREAYEVSGDGYDFYRRIEEGVVLS